MQLTIKLHFYAYCTCMIHACKTGHVSTLLFQITQLFLLIDYGYEISQLYLTFNVIQVTEYKYSVPMLRNDLLCFSV